MRRSTKTKSISALQAHIAEFFNGLNGQSEPSVITQKSEPTAALQDVASFDAGQKTLVLLKLLALGEKEVAAGKVKPIGEVLSRIKAKRTQA